MSKSKNNLKEAFAGESQASMKYRAFALKADIDGYGQAARLFRATELAEMIHAHNHLKALGQLGSTEDNLQTGIEGETYEFSDMYPRFMADAEAEGDKDALRCFRFASDAERVHAELYKKYLSDLKKGDADIDVYVCMVCGHVEEGDAPEACPLCGAKKAAFRKVD